MSDPPDQRPKQPTADAACPRCGGRAVPILYGKPVQEMFDAAARGEVVLGGCVVEPDAPDRRCAACRHEWAAPAQRGGATG